MNPIDITGNGNICIISMSSPPVNSLGFSLRQALEQAFLEALDNDSYEAILLTSNGKLFSGGADINEFDSDAAYSRPSLPELCDFIENSPKLVVAGINGSALGGGCELALACDYRIADASAKIGLPEVKLGILPGAGGTQRLPRLGGAELAVDMITSGKPFSAGALLERRVLDAVCNKKNFSEAALAYTQELLAKKAPFRSCEDLSVDVTELAEDYFSAAKTAAKRRYRGLYAPEKCIDAVEAACALPLREGLHREAELFKECMKTPQARALQHLFFAERAASKVPGIDKSVSVRPVRKVAVIGSGTMGGGIAMSFMNAGIETILLDLNEEALGRGVGLIEKNYNISVKKGRISEAQLERCMALLTSTTEYADISDVDLVIEAVFEKMEIKKNVFLKLDEVCAKHTILATNTSTLDVNEIAKVTKRPESVVGMHFFSPANVMRLLEIVRGGETSDEVLQSTIKVAQKIKKVPVVSGVCWGFIGNRMLEPYGRECARMILEGASPGQIDRVLSEFGFAMGFPSMADLAGIDVSYLVRQGNKEACYSRDPHYAAILDKLYELGRFGQKSGRGFYVYEGREKSEDPEVMEVAQSLALELGIKQREISDQDIIERAVYMLINEGAQILDEGIALRPGDIDTVYCNGYGFPVAKGGPMHLADELGLSTILNGIERHRKALGAYGEEWFQPSSLLRELVGDNKTFKQFRSD